MGVTVAVGPARAEHLTLAPAEPTATEERRTPSEGRPTVDINIDIKLGTDGFRMGGRVTSPQGVWGGWLNGTIRPDGFTLDGRVQDPDRATNFKLNADVLEWLLRGWPGGSL